MIHTPRSSLRYHSALQRSSALILDAVRLLLTLTATLLAACAPPPRPVEQPKPDRTNDASYVQAVDQLAALTRAAEKLFQSGQSDRAGAMIAEAQALLNRLLSVPRPTLAAMEAISDSDRLYCRMLLANRHYGWARLLFQKELTRWKTWKPQTPETARRLKAAATGIAECDRRLGE